MGFANKTEQSWGGAVAGALIGMSLTMFMAAVWTYDLVLEKNRYIQPLHSPLELTLCI